MPVVPTTRAFPVVTTRRLVIVRAGLVETKRVRAFAFPPVLTVVVAVGFVALTFVFDRTWSFPEAAKSDPVNNAPVTTLTSMRFVFISLFWF